MVTWYWATEYMKVLAGYIFIMFIWPSVVLRKYLRGRSVTFWFGFCVTFQPILVYIVVIALGLLHILNIWVMRGLFYIPFALEVLKWLGWGGKETKNVKHLLNGTYGIKLFCHNILSGIGKRVGSIWRMLCSHLRGHWMECGVLSVILVYGMIYFTYGIFQNYSPGAGDMYVHNAWVYGLLQGKVFSAGVYPEGMHCVIYGLHVLFGIRMYSCMLFLQPVHVVVFMLSVVVFLREVFHWKYTPMFVLVAFLTLDVMQANAVISMSRLQWTLPQEFGFPSIFLCAAFLVRYLRSTKRRAFRGKLTKGYWDENLLLFGLSLAVSLTIHFYPTIMMFFVCLGFVPVSLRKIFSRKRFVPLAATVVAGFLLAVFPLAAARATGIPFEGSINWAMSIIRGPAEEQEDDSQQEDTQQSDTQGDNAQQAEQGDTQQESQQGDSQQAGGDTMTGQPASESGSSGETALEGSSQAGSGAGDFEAHETVVQESPAERAARIYHRVLEIIQDKWNTIFHAGYIGLFGRERAEWIVFFSVLVVLIWICYRIPAGFLKLLLRKREKKPKPGYFDQYLSIVLVQFIFIVVYCAKYLGLPTLIEDYRLASVEQLLVLAMIGVPVDAIFTIFRLLIGENVLKVVSVAAAGGIAALVVLTGNYHGYLCVVLTRLNGAVLCTQSITQTMPKGSYTIVSPTDELYQMIQYGWHEELITFANKVQSAEYRLPSEYVFIYIEKTPISYAQYHLYEGPAWLAETGRYAPYFSSTSGSQSPDMIMGELNPEELSEGGRFFNVQSSTYSMLITRSMVESVAYIWCQAFEGIYPGELKVFYEDDNFICYYFKQNPQSLYQLGILY